MPTETEIDQATEFRRDRVELARAIMFAAIRHVENLGLEPHLGWSASQTGSRVTCTRLRFYRRVDEVPTGRRGFAPRKPHPNVDSAD